MKSNDFNKSLFLIKKGLRTFGIGVMETKRGKMTTKEILHKLRNPYGLSEEEKRAVQLKAAKEKYVHVLLLDYKPMGRGKNFSSESTVGWLDIVKEFDSRVSIDSFLAKRLVELDPDKKWVHPASYDPDSDGHVSMYLDLVEGKFAKHSFVPKNEQKEWSIMKTYGSHEMNIDEMWAELGKV